MNIRFAALAVSTALLGCTRESQVISRAIDAQVRNKELAQINVSSVGPQGWEQFCVLTPYTNNERAKAVLGFEWDAEGKTSIASSDSINVLVFVRRGAVAAYTEYPRGLGDFSRMSPRCLPREKASFVRALASDGWVLLMAANGV